MIKRFTFIKGEINTIGVLVKNSILLPFMLLIVSPLSFYFGNINEVNFTLSDVWLPVLAVFIASSLSLFLLQILTVKIKFALRYSPLSRQKMGLYLVHFNSLLCSLI